MKKNCGVMLALCYLLCAIDASAMWSSNAFKARKAFTQKRFNGGAGVSRSTEYDLSYFQALIKTPTVKIAIPTITEEQTAWVASIIKNNREQGTALREFDLTFTQIDAEIMVTLLDSFQGLSVERLGFEGCTFTEEAFSSLANFVADCTTLRHLDLSFTGLEDDGVKEISEAIVKSSSLETLKLSYNKITAIGAHHVGEMLRQNRSLTKLVISDNPLGKAGVSSIINSFKASDHLLANLTLLDVDTNNYEGTEKKYLSLSYDAPDLHKELYSMLARNKRLKEQTKLATAHNDGAGVSSQVISMKTNFEQLGIGGMNDQIEKITRILLPHLAGAEKRKAYGLKPDKGLILEGPPGSGKTLLATAICNAIQCTKRFVSGSEFYNMWLGESEKNLRTIFSEAQNDPNKPFLIIFDEIDAIAKKRQRGPDSDTDDRIFTMLLTLLDGLDGKDKTYDNVFVIGITNILDAIDPALLRPGRLGTIIHVPLPDVNGREKIFNVYLKPLIDNNLLDGNALEWEQNMREFAIATDGLSGADIAQIMNDAKLDALKGEFVEHNETLTINLESKNLPKITMSDIDSALKKLKASREHLGRKKPNAWSAKALNNNE